MAEQKLGVVTLKDDFYRDGFYKVIVALLIIAITFAFILAVSIYIYSTRPPPVQFFVGNEWRTLQPVAVDKRYLTDPEVLQWVSEVLPGSLKYDFVNYKTELDDRKQYFTQDGWPKFLEMVNNFISYETVQNAKLFVNTTPTSAPIILNQGLLQGRYAWWVQMDILINYISFEKTTNQSMQIQALVVRIPTMQNLDGVSIDNIIVKRT
jgi:intracellular multiplication protein IcmL